MVTTTEFFEVSSKSIFLTYPNCNLDQEEAINQLLRLETANNIKYILVARELHQSGNPHLHVLIQFENKLRCRNHRFFDIFSTNPNQKYHPNIQSAKSPENIKRYIEKEGNIKSFGEYQEDKRKKRRKFLTPNETYDLVAKAKTKEEALETIKTEQPRDYFIQHHNILATLDKIYETPAITYTPPYPPESFNNVPEEILAWKNQQLPEDPAARPNRPKSIIIEGPSRTGKTEWARSLGLHNYINGHLDLNPTVYSNEAQYTIIDDIDPQYLKHFRQFVGCHKDWTSNCKYGKPRKIKGQIPVIILCNPGPGASYELYINKYGNEDLKRYVQQNSVSVKITESFYT